MAEAIDTAFVEIRPDFTRFGAETQRGIRQQLAGVNTSLALSPNTRRLAGANGELARTTTNLNNIQRGATKANAGLSVLGGTASRVGTVGAAGVAGLVAGVGLATASLAKASIDFETAFSGVRKTVSATAPELAKIREDLLDLSTTIPVSAVELANIAESAGQLGVSTPAVAGFTKVIAELGVTTNLTQEQAADAFARIANITQLPQDKFDEMGSTVVALGNKLAATESEITDFGLRIAGAGKQVGLSNSEILSIGAALSSVGLEAEAGGTAISTTLIKIASAVKGGGKKLEAFAAVAGESAETFRKEFSEKPAAALVKFVSGLGRIGKEGGNVFATLEKLGLGGIRVRDALLRSAGAGDLLAKSLRIGDQAWKQNTALQREASIRFETTASKITLLRNEITRIAIDAGDKLGPAIGDGASAAAEGLERLRKSAGFADFLADSANSIKTAFKAVGSVVSQNAGNLRSILDNLKETFQNLLPTIKLSAAIMVGSFVAALKVAIPIVKLLSDGVRLLSEAWAFTVKKIIQSIDIFLGGISTLTDALSHVPLIGDKFAGVSDDINAAREVLRDFAGDVDSLNGKTVSITVDADTSAAQAKINSLIASAKGIQGSVNTIAGQPTFGLTPLTPKVKAGKGKPPPVNLPPPVADVPKAIQAREQRLRDNLALAQTTDGILSDDRAALQALAAFYDEEAANLKLAANLRRGFSVNAAQARAEITRLDQQETDRIQSDAETRARNRVAAAEATKGTLRDDIAAQRDLVAVLKQRVAIARAAGSGVAQAQSDLAAAQRDLADKISERRTRRIDIRIEHDKTLVEAADATEENLRDDVRSRQRLVADLKARVRIVKATKGDVVSARADLDAAKTDLRKTIKETNKARADLRQDALEDAVTLAQLRGDKSAEQKALAAEVAFWRNRVRSLKKGSVERRKALIEMERAKKDLRDLTGKSGTTGTTAFDLLSQAAGRFNQFGGNLIGTDQPFAGPTGFTADLAQWLRRRPGAAGVSSQTNPMAGFQGGVDRLVDALDRNTNAQEGKDEKATATKPGTRAPKSGAATWGSGAWRWQEAGRARAYVGAFGGG